MGDSPNLKEYSLVTQEFKIKFKNALDMKSEISSRDLKREWDRACGATKV